MRFKQKIILCLFFSLSVLLIYLPANYFTWFKVSLDDVEEIAETIVEEAPEVVEEVVVEEIAVEEAPEVVEEEVVEEEIAEEEVPELVEEAVEEEIAEELESELAGEVESEISEEDSIVDNQEVVENYTEGDLFTEEEALDSVNTTQTIQQEDLAIGTGENKQVEDVNENLLNQVEQLLLKLNQDELEILKFKFFDVITEEKDDVYGGTNENTQFFREFNNYQIEKAQDKKQEDEKMFDVYKNFLKDYFGKDNFTNNFEKLNEKIYFFEDDLLDSGSTLIRRNKEEEFTVSLKSANLYFIGLSFSKDIDYESLKNSSFKFKDKQGKTYLPDKIFVSDNEAILIFEGEEVKDAYLLELNKITDIEANYLDGYFSLLNNSYEYLELTEKVNNSYEVYYSDDLEFNVSKLSFGRFDTYNDSDSTIELEIAGVSGLDEKCALLVFAEDLIHEDGRDKIKKSSISLLAESEGKVPIDDKIVKEYEEKSKKSFTGFVYFSDLEDQGNSKLLYMNMLVEAGKDRGRYVADMSLEVYCPN